MYETLKSQEAIDAEDDADDAYETRVAMLTDIMQTDNGMMTHEEMTAQIQKEFAVFQAGEPYDYVTDLKRQYNAQMQDSLSVKMLKTIPDHYFWDIKAPIKQEENYNSRNPYNAARAYPHQDFFDHREHEKWLNGKAQQRNITSNISSYKNY